MKKVFLTTSLCLLFAAAAFAGGNKTNLFKELAAAMNVARQTAYKTTASFRATALLYNGKPIHAFFDNSNGNLICFSIPLQASDLPAGTIASIQHKYSGCKISEAMLYVDDNGNARYFVSATSAHKPTLILELNAKNKVSVYARM